MLKPSLTGWRAQYDRMQRSYARVTGAYTSSVAYEDDLHHFMQDCWHLTDWIKEDPLVGIGIRHSIQTRALKSKSLRIVKDLAMASKHLRRDNHKEGAYVTSTNVTVHLGQRHPIDVNYVVTLSDGTCTLAESIVHEAFNDWDALLRELGLSERR